MIATETKITPTAVHLQNKGNEPFFKKQGQGNLFTKSNEPTAPFFNPTFIQPKLTIGQPNDEYEKEADAMADKVMRMPDVKMPIQRKCAHCEEEEKQKLQKKSEPDIALGVPSGIESGLASSKGNGRSLPSNVRAQMEHSFGADFSGVKLHTDSHAVQMNNDLHAQAFTHGNNIYFNAGKYHPEAPEGKHLLAHELTHVAQQGGNRISTMIRRQPAAPAGAPNFRDCTPGITGQPDSTAQLEAARQRAREFVGAAIRILGTAPAPGSAYATALNRHFINPTAAQRAVILNNFTQIRGTLRVNNYICNSNNICGTEQAFWIAADDLVHVCPPFWGIPDRTCKAIVLIHEGAHDIGVDAALAGHPPNRGSAAYPAGNVAPPAGQTTAQRIQNPDAYAFFAAHTWRSTDTSRTCF